MRNKIIALLMILTFPFVSLAEEKFKYVKSQTTASYSGYLLTPEALSKVVANKKADAETCDLDKETTRSQCDIKLIASKRICEISIELKDQNIKELTTLKDSQITDLGSKLDASERYKKWYLVGGIVGGFMVGFLTSEAVAYITTR